MGGRTRWSDTNPADFVYYDSFDPEYKRLLLMRSVCVISRALDSA